MARLREVLDYDSKYTYQNGVLKNKLGITDKEKLKKSERIITNYKLADLYVKNITGNFDINHYLSIHKYIFQDIYDFAGEIRSENIKKSIPFCLPNFIYDNLKETLNRARIESYKIKSEEQLIEFLAKYYSELDIIHPFREGNGRTEREFLRQYIEEISNRIDFGNYELDYSKIEDKDSFIKAIIIADATCDYSLLKEYMKVILVNRTYQNGR